MKRGEVYWVRFDPAVGGEIQKTRPAVIVSNDQTNKYLNRVQVVPITSQTDKLYPSEALITVQANAARLPRIKSAPWPKRVCKKKLLR